MGEKQKIIDKHLLAKVFCRNPTWESVRMRLTLPKWELGSPPGLPKFQSSIIRVKTPCIGVLFISLERY
jgi:hypothetical protein